uniref:Uncharacterized protein n=1 Tax=Solanum tuberosum TaxID=4113 RepID=M1A0M7_SOLTU
MENMFTIKIKKKHNFFQWKVSWTKVASVTLDDLNIRLVRVTNQLGQLVTSFKKLIVK